MNWDREKKILQSGDILNWSSTKLPSEVSGGAATLTQEQLSGEVLIRQIYDYTSENAFYLAERGGLE